MDFVANLNAAIVDTEELYTEDAALEYDDTNYTSLDQLVEGIRNLPVRPVRVKNGDLSINGSVKNDSMDSYLSKHMISSSLLKEALNSPRHYLIARNGVVKKEGKHFDFGTFAHSAVLEPSKFAKIFIEPKFSRTSTDGILSLISYYADIVKDYAILTQDFASLKMAKLKEILASLELRAEIEGYTFVDQDTVKIIEVLNQSCKTYGNGLLPKIVPYIKTETSFYTKDRQSGLKVKIRPDGMMLEENFGVNAIVSVKTTSAGSKEEFERDAAKYKYELAEGMYLQVASEVTGRKFTGCMMIMLQNCYPFQIAVFWWNSEDLEVGKYKYAQAMDVIRTAQNSNEWLGFDAKAEDGNFGIIEMKLPSYIKSELPPQC